MKIILIILTIFLSSCKLNKIVKHHGIHNLESKGEKLLINISNENQIISKYCIVSSSTVITLIFICLIPVSKNEFYWNQCLISFAMD